MSAHMKLWIKGASSPEKICEQAKVDLCFRQRLLEHLENIASECLPENVHDEWMDIDDDIADVNDELQVNNASPERIFPPFPHPNSPDFERHMQRDVYHIVHLRQIHSRRHNPTCFKYGRQTCRFRFPRRIVLETNFITVPPFIEVFALLNS